ncbi:Exodeoxyribonuclease 8 [Halomonadaceae bacterium LMG 33818]|uniref:PD-(D/E)XK nuclease-like domain-containing protein n=1 Tax=Cernens ardua TaxID=3402176 RepID=UPI003EDC2F59
MQFSPTSPGYYIGIPNEVYHAGAGVSKSQLDLIHKSPSLFQWSCNAPEDESKKTALNMGDACHARILEPERYRLEYAIGPENAPRNTKAGKESWAEFEASLTGQTVLTAEEGRKIELIFESVMAHPNARFLIEQDGDVESSIYWNESSTGELCRCRPDKLCTNQRWIVDLKSTADMDRFTRAFYGYRYHVQDAFYSDGYEAQFGEPPAGFLFIAFSTSIDCGRYPVRLFSLDLEAKVAGRNAYINDVQTYSQCKANGFWPGIETLSLPRWAKELAA